MEPGVKDRDFMYQLIIGQLYHDGHKQLALDLSNSIGMSPSLPPADKLFQLVSTAQLVKDDDDEEEKGTDIQISLNPIIPSIDNLSIDEESRDYFPFLALPTELQVHVFSHFSIRDRMKARVNKSLVAIEASNKYYVNKLLIGEKCCIRAPSPYPPCLYSEDAQTIVFLESKSYSSDCIRRIAHNASIGDLEIKLSGSSEFHREVYNMIKEIDIRELTLTFQNKDLEREMMVESFVLDLARACKDLWIRDSENVTPETIHAVYKILLDGSTKLRYFYFTNNNNDKCIAFLQLIGITYRDDAFFSNRDIEVYKQEDVDGNVVKWYIFDGSFEMTMLASIFEDVEYGDFDFFYHETPESLEKAKNGLERVEVDSE